MSLVLVFCGLATAHAQRQSAQQVIDAIVKANGAAPVPDTVDTIKGGDPNTPVTGIVTTFMDTFDVLQKAVAAGDNLVITHEPTFYNHVDSRALFPGDPVVAAKLAYIEQHHLVVWRFHDGWHHHQPDGILEGVVQQLGWEPYRQPASSASTPANLFHLPATTIGALAATLREKTGSPVVRVIGDPAASITNVALLPGASGLNKQVTLMERADVQALIVGEAPEWEAVEYARDATAEARAGLTRPKALIVLGHEPSEEGGMQYCATWLKTVLPGIRIDFIPAGSPFSDVVTKH
jgi:putative NIF3 family GTP cyclohydrolase 1 type 2